LLGNRIKTRIKTRIRSVILAGAALAVLAPAALAAGGGPTNVTVTGGNLTLTGGAPGNFAGVTLDGTVKTTQATMAAFSVNDFRGNDAGWHVDVSATQFREYASGAYVTGGESIPTGSLTLSAPTVSPSGPTITSGAPYTIDGGSAVKVASAAGASGAARGTFTFSATTLTLTVPANQTAASYRSDVTIDGITGP